MAYNYVVTAQKPTSVTHSLTGAFTSPIDMNLILAKCSRLEIHRMTPDGLSPVLDVQIYGRVAVLELFRPENEKKDLMFLCTEHYQFCVLAYDPETQRVLTRARGNVRDAIGRCADVMQGVVDPRCRVIGLFLYEGYYKVLPVDPKTGTLRESFNVRLHELRVLNIVFLDGFAHPTLGLLYEDNRGGKHVKTYSILVKERELVEGPWYQSNVEPGARLLVPVPSPAGGVIIVGETSIVYHSGKTFKAISIPNALIDVYTSIDADRTLLADTFGNLHVLALDRPTPEKVKTLRIECLGKTSAASTLSYLDTGVVFVGSAMGDSQLIRLLAERSVVDNDQPQSSFIQILDTYTNVGPIVDFCVMDLDRQGQGQIVSCSGAYKDGSLRVIRSGIGLAEQATIEMPGVKGMWALGEHSDAMYDKYLVMSFISETRVMVLNGEELEELDTLVGFAEDTKTLCCHTMLGGFWIQVTETQVRLISTSTFQMVDKWAPEEEEGANRISVATATSTQIVVATLGGKVYVLDIVGNNIREVNQVTFGHEISCLAISSSENHKMCAVGLWVDISVTLISLPGCQKLKIEPLGGQVIPRSVIFGCFHALEYLFVGLGDGSLVSYKLKSTRATDDDRELIYDRKKVTLGSQPITLARFQTKGQEHIFAASDRPTIIYSNTDKLLYSNVNAKEVMLMCPFNGASFPDSLALVSETEMMVGNIDDIQKLHIQSYHLNEWPRRIAHDPRSNTVAVCTLKNPEDEENGGPAEIGDLSFVRLFDDQNFDMLDFYQLDPMEYACSITVCGSTFGNPTDALDTLTKEGSAPFYYVVGTAYAHDEEPEPHQGRILIFSILGHGCDRKLHLCCEKDVTGAVYCVMEFQGQLVAGVNSKTDIYKLVVVDGEKELVHECGHHGNILVLYLQCHGDFIIVGDLMKSISLLKYSATTKRVEEVARDLNTNWMTAVDMIDDEYYVGAETEFNLFTVRRNAEAASDEERARLEVQGEYHLGEFVNRFQKGSLVMQQPIAAMTDPEDSPTDLTSNHHHPSNQSVLFATVNGTIGVILSLTRAQYEFFEHVQLALNEVIQGIGGFSHAEWRMFTNARKTTAAKNFVDGDLIESMLDLTNVEMNKVVAIMNSFKDPSGHQRGENPEFQLYTVDEVTKRIEDMAQLH